MNQDETQDYGDYLHVAMRSFRSSRPICLFCLVCLVDGAHLDHLGSILGMDTISIPFTSVPKAPCFQYVGQRQRNGRCLMTCRNLDLNHYLHTHNPLLEVWTHFEVIDQ